MLTLSSALLVALSPECDPDSGYFNQDACDTQGIGHAWSSLFLGHPVFGPFLVLFLITLFFVSFRTVRQGQEGVVFFLGKVRGKYGAGPHLIIPFGRMEKVVVATVDSAQDSQTAVTKDSVSISIVAVVYYRVTDSILALTAVDDYESAIDNFAQSAMRTVIGGKTLAEVLEHGETVNIAIKAVMDELAAQWGITVLSVQLKDVELPENLKRAMAAAAEARLDAEARVASAHGQQEAAAILAEAAATLGAGGMQLANMELLRLIGANQTTIIVATSSDSTAAFTAAGAKAALTAGPAASTTSVSNPEPGAPSNN